MKLIVNCGELITGPAFDEGREQRYGAYSAVLVKDQYYVIRRIHSLAIAGSC
jgi:hypothetical protein